LKLQIKEIAAGGQQFSRQLSASELAALLAQAGVAPIDERGWANVELALSKVDETILVRGSLEGQFRLACSRCLAPASVEVDEPDFRLTFLPESMVVVEGDDVELTQDDLDAYAHDGLVIDLEPLVREHLVMAIPIAPLCREDCAGVCPSCGINRNDDACECGIHEKLVSPWKSALGALKDGLSKGR
jgi:uncharacterized protein